MKKVIGNEGFTLLETMIIAGLLLALIAAFSTYQFQRSREEKARNTRATLNQLQSNIQNQAVQGQSIQKTEEAQFPSQ